MYNRIILAKHIHVTENHSISIFNNHQIWLYCFVILIEKISQNLTGTVELFSKYANTNENSTKCNSCISDN